jgi:hypothetical protein
VNCVSVDAGRECVCAELLGPACKVSAGTSTTCAHPEPRSASNWLTPPHNPVSATTTHTQVVTLSAVPGGALAP